MQAQPLGPEHDAEEALARDIALLSDTLSDTLLRQEGPLVSELVE